MSDEERHVQAERHTLDRVQVFPERPPASHQPVRAQGQLDELPPGVGDRGKRFAAVARQLGREPLAHMADQGPVEKQRAVRVPVRVDEPRGDDKTGGIDHLRHADVIDRRQVIDGEDAVAEHADVRATAGSATAIDDGAVANQQIEGGHVEMMPPRTAH